MRMNKSLATRRFTTGDMVEVTRRVCRRPVAISTVDYWLAMGLLGNEYTERAGRGTVREFTIMQVSAVAIGVRWAEAEASPERVQSLISFVAQQNIEHMEAEFADGRTFAVPPIMLVSFVAVKNTGTFIAPEKEGPTAKLFRELDLAACWKDVQAAIAKLPEKRARGRKKQVK